MQRPLLTKKARILLAILQSAEVAAEPGAGVRSGTPAPGHGGTYSIVTVKLTTGS